MIKQIQNVKQHGITPVVAINAFETDHPEEYDAIRRIAVEAGALGAAVTYHHRDGGTGAGELAQMVIDATNQPNNFQFLYDEKQPIKAKIETIARKIYGAADVSYTPQALTQIS